MEFLVTMTTVVPDGTADPTIDELRSREATRSRELAEEGHVVRLWTLPPTPGHWRALGLWRAEDANELQVILKSLPMDTWMTTEATPLTEHPNDPASSET